MTGLVQWLAALPGLMLLALLAWAIATRRHNVGLVDIAWPLFILLAVITHLALRGAPNARSWLVVGIVALWALRLSVHLAVRNWDAEEDRRYQAIRKRNDPGFWWKSLYLVFGFQTLLALIVAAAPYGVIAAPEMHIGWLDTAGILLALAGLTFEAVADWQLKHFLATRRNREEVMDRGLWHYSRHPNYFGEFCVWWGVFLIALSGGAWWAIVSPLLMSVLLLRVSGVTLLEKDMGRRPGYAAYIKHTNAFFPGPVRTRR